MSQYFDERCKNCFVSSIVSFALMQQVLKGKCSKCNLHCYFRIRYRLCCLPLSTVRKNKKAQHITMWQLEHKITAPVFPTRNLKYQNLKILHHHSQSYELYLTGLCKRERKHYLAHLTDVRWCGNRKSRKTKSRIVCIFLSRKSVQAVGTVAAPNHLLYAYD